MIYDFGKKVEATAIINRPEINSSTKDEWWSEQVYFHRKNAVSSLATDCILPRWPPAENEQVRTSSTSIEKGHAHTHTHKTKLFPVWKRLMYISSNHIQTSQHWTKCQGTEKMCMFHLLHTLSCTLSVTSYPCKLQMPFREQGKIVWLATNRGAKPCKHEFRQDRVYY